MTKKIIALVSTAIYLAGALAVLAGCNTVEGMGKDIEHGGAKIKEEARENK